MLFPHTAYMRPDPETEIWFFDDAPQSISNADLISHLELDERVRAERIRIPEKQRALAFSRLAARQCLTRSELGLPETADIAIDREGCPRVLGAEDISVSWSRSEQSVAVALSRGEGLGLDLETLRALEYRPMLDMICDTDEKARFLSLPEAAHEIGFLALWTAKEAVLKALGKGFQGPVKSILTPPALYETQEGSSAHMDFEGRAFRIDKIIRPQIILTLAKCLG